MRDFQRLRSLSGLLVVFVALSVFCLGSVAQPTLVVELGFEGRLAPSHYAPIQIEVVNYQHAGASRLRITQVAGNAWRGEATLQHELGYAIQANGIYKDVIPVYDPANPIIVELLSNEDELLARQIVDPRDLMRATPYPVLDMKLPRFDDRAAIVPSSSLPAQWWGLDSAESLWIASSLPSESWTAISQWVLAGGSLVVLTGTNFYRMDSPILRDLLPIADPQIATTNWGTSYLTGSHEQATIDMHSDEGFPLLLQKAYGAGQVSLVTVQPQALSVEQLKLIASYIQPSQLITFESLTETLLGAETIVALDSLLVLPMIAILVAVVCVCAVVGRRNAKAGWAILVAISCAVAVLSGFASNPTTTNVHQYIFNSTFYLQDTVSLLSVSSSFYSQLTSPFVQIHFEDVLPLQFLPRGLRGANSLSSLTTPGKTEQQVPAGDLRHWHAYGNAAAVFDLAFLSDATVRISNYHPAAFDNAWILMDGAVHPLGRVPRGSMEFDVDPATSISMGTFLSAGYTLNATSLLRLIREMKDVLSLSKGIWIIAANEKEQLIPGDISKKVSDVTLVIARAEENSHAN